MKSLQIIMYMLKCIPISFSFNLNMLRFYDCPLFNFNTRKYKESSNGNTL